MDPQFYSALSNFEKTFHGPIWDWIVHKVENASDGSKIATSDLEILDLSQQPSIFSLMLAERYPPKRLVCAVRDANADVPTKDRPYLSIARVCLDGSDEFAALKTLGKFDIIILKEVAHEIVDLTAFFTVVQQHLLRTPESQCFLLCRPKNPPLPIPDVALLLWRKYAVTRDQVLGATQKIPLKLIVYSASIPIRIKKQDWLQVLRSGTFPAVRDTKKCNDREIREFIETRSLFMAFEEKVQIFLVRALKPGEALIDDPNDPNASSEEYAAPTFTCK